jgi:SpoIID/LytB domain protein
MAGVVAAGLRAAAATGSAAVLADGWADTLAKTGTVQTPSGSQGLVVARRPEADLDILVRVNGGSGRDAAAIAREVLARHEGREPPLRIGRVPDARADAGVPVRVDTVAMEPYVEAVVAAEGTPDMRPPVLEALAVAARTFAAAHRNRHGDEGFDLCDTTHCQVTAAAPWPAARAAAERTRGLVLARHGRVVPVQYAAACAGRLHDARVIWGGDEVGHGLVGVEPHPHPVPRWSSDVSVDDLMRVLDRVGVRGGPLRALTVRAHAEDGLPRLVGLEGMHPDVMSAGVFRTAMGRTLGWHVLKSHHWRVERTSRGYRFHGAGKGHGVGLCLAGAQALATGQAGGHAAGQAAGGGATAEGILSTYLPGLHVRSLADAVQIRVSTDSERLAPDVASLVWRTLARLREDLQLSAPRRIEIVEHPTTEAYQRATGRAWWTAASTRSLDPGSARIDLVPFGPLVRSGRLEAVLRHELAHALTDATLSGAPLWAREGLAVVLAGEVSSSAAGAADGPCPDDAAMARPGSAEAMREQYARAAACVQRHLDSGRTWRGLK